MWYSNDMFHYIFKAEFFTLVSLKSPVGLSAYGLHMFPLLPQVQHVGGGGEGAERLLLQRGGGRGRQLLPHVARKSSGKKEGRNGFLAFLSSVSKSTSCCIKKKLREQKFDFFCFP